MNESITHLKTELLECRKCNEYAEVVLLNLLRLVDDEQNDFLVPFDDVVVTVRLAIKLLNSAG